MDAEYYAGLYDWDFEQDEPTLCKFCRSPIEWRLSENGKFRTVTPERGYAHTCKGMKEARAKNALNLLPEL